MFIRDVELLVLALLIIALPFVIITMIMKAARKNETNPKGWFPDPEVPGQYRYYDGDQWTDLHTTADPQVGKTNAPGEAETQ